MTSDGHGDGLSELPGFGALAPELQALLRSAERDDPGDRPRLLERVADVVNVFAALDLLQFIFMPPEEAPQNGVVIDLTAPEVPDSAAVAWFRIAEAGYDEYRDSVTMFGELVDVLNPPIVLDLSDGEEELTPDD